MAINSSVEWKTYTNHDFGYSIEYPSRWYVDPRIRKTRIYMDRQIRSNDLDYYTPIGGTFSISKPSRNSIGDIESIISISKNKTIESITKMKLFENIRILEDISTIKYVIDGKKAGSYTWTASYTDEIKKKWSLQDTIEEIVYVVNNDNVYVFQFIALTEFFNMSENKNIRTHMFNSIKWENDKFGTPIWKLIDIIDFISELYKS